MKSLFPAPVEALFPEKSKDRVKEILEDINRYLDHYGLEADSLIDMQVKGYLLDYYQNAGLPKSTTPSSFNVLALEHPGGTKGSIDIPLVMAYVHGGGSLADLASNTSTPHSKRVNANIAIEVLLKNSPQGFLIGTGLICSPLTNRMYFSWAEHVVKSHTSDLVEIVENLPDHHARSAKVFLTLLADKLKWVPPGSLRADLTHEQLQGFERDRFSPETYREIVQYSGGYKPSLDNSNLINNVFLADAFVQLEGLGETPQIAENLMRKAGVMLRTMQAFPHDEKAVAEQLVACAFVAHPEPFKTTYDLKNLVGFPTEAVTDETGCEQRILSGPSAFFMNYQGMSGPDNELFVLQHCKTLNPDFSINSIIRENGVGHSALTTLIRIEKDCYYPALEEFVLQHPLNADRGRAIAFRIHADGVAEKYSPEALFEIYKSYFIDFPLHDSKSDLDAPQETTFVSPNIPDKFKAAYDQVKGFQELVISRLDALEGITQAHLRATGLDSEKAPQLVKKLNVRDRGRQFTQELGV